MSSQLSGALSEPLTPPPASAQQEKDSTSLVGFGAVEKFSETVHTEHSSHVVIALLMPDLGPRKASQHLLNTVASLLVVSSFFSEPGAPQSWSPSHRPGTFLLSVSELPGLLSFQPGLGMSCSLLFTNSHLLFFFLFK